MLDLRTTAAQRLSCTRGFFALSDFGRKALAAARHYDPQTAVVVMWRPTPQALKETLREAEGQPGHHGTPPAPVETMVETFALEPAAGAMESGKRGRLEAEVGLVQSLIGLLRSTRT